jgi:hypothetical protein
MHAGVLERKREGRDEVQEVEDIHGEKYDKDCRSEHSSTRSLVFASGRSQEEKEEIQQREADSSAEKEDERADSVQHDRQNENRETKEREEEETNLEVEARVLLLEFFIGQEGRAEDQEKRPAHPQAAAPEVKDQERAEQSTEKKLKNVDEPEMGFGWVLRIGGTIFRAIDEQDAEGYDGEVYDNPEILPKRINAFERNGIEGEASKE